MQQFSLTVRRKDQSVFAIASSDDVQKVIKDALLPSPVSVDRNPLPPSGESETSRALRLQSVAHVLAAREETIFDATEILRTLVEMDACNTPLRPEIRLGRDHVITILDETSNEVPGVRFSALRLLNALIRASMTAVREGRYSLPVVSALTPSHVSQSDPAPVIKRLVPYEMAPALPNDVLRFKLVDLIRLHHNIRPKALGGGNEQVPEVVAETKLLIATLTDRLLPIERSAIDDALTQTRQAKEGTRLDGIRKLKVFAQTAIDCMGHFDGGSNRSVAPPFTEKDHQYLLSNMTIGDFEKGLVHRTECLQVMGFLRQIFPGIEDPQIKIAFPENGYPLIMATRPASATGGQGVSAPKPDVISPP